MVPLMVKGLMSPPNLVVRVSFMTLGGAVWVILWLGWAGLAVDSRNCFDSMVLCAFTGMHLASEWRWS